MTKRLVVPFLVIGMGLWGCSSSSTKKDAAPTGGTGGGTGGTGGGTGGTGGGTGGTGGGTGGTGGIRLDGAPRDVAAGDTTPAGDTAPPRLDTGAGNLDGPRLDTAAAEAGAAQDFCTGYVMGTTIVPAQPAAAFCTKYNAVCVFGASPEYTDMADCMMRYPLASDMGSCRATHLCNANISAGMATTHCPHAQAVPTGPCSGM